MAKTELLHPKTFGRNNLFLGGVDAAFVTSWNRKNLKI